MKAAVTGANGFVGHRIVTCLCDHGISVRAATRREVNSLPAGASRVTAPDLGADADWTEVVEGMDVIIHSAARVHIMRDDAVDSLVEFRRVNLDGTVALAKAAAAAGVKRFLFLSSIKVNGEDTPADIPFRAADAPNPSDAYGISKLEAEQALFNISRETGIEIVIIRPVLVYGPGVRANFRAMMAAAARGVPLPLGAITNRRSMVFVGNLADLVRVAAAHPAAVGKVLLASDGHDLSTTQMLRLLATGMRKPARLLPVPPKLLDIVARLVGKRSFAQRLLGSLTVDIAPTCNLLGWSPPYSVEQGFLETAEAYVREGRSN